MSDMSTNLQLTYLAAGQAQKHISVNESLLRLDALVQLNVVSANTSGEPGSPADGALYIVPPGKSGAAWDDFTDWALAYYRDGAWEQIPPREGWLALVKDTGELLYYGGSDWRRFPAAQLLTVTATDRVLGRVSSGAGAAEEIVFTGAAQALCDDADAAAMRTTLGLGTAALAADSTLAHLAGAETLTGDKTFSGNLQGASGKASVGRTPVSSYGLVVRSPGTGSNWAQVWENSAGSNIMAVKNDGSLSFTGNSYPGVDNAYSTGLSSNRWSVVYAATGTINTSDAREKSALGPLPASVKRAVRRIMAGVGVFQWLASVAAKGEDGARLHVGVTAQAVRDAFAAEGEDAARWALFCADALLEPAAPGEDEPRPLLDEHGAPVVRLGVRTDQLLMLALAVLFDGEAKAS